MATNTPDIRNTGYLRVDNANVGVDTALHNVVDGDGVATPLQVSSTDVNINGNFLVNGTPVTGGGSVSNDVLRVSNGNAGLDTTPRAVGGGVGSSPLQLATNKVNIQSGLAIGGADVSANVLSLLGAADYAAIRTLLGLVIGTNVQAYDAELAALAGLVSAANALPYFTGSGTAAVTTLSSFIRTLLDDVDAATARGTLGLAIGTDVQAYDAELAALAGLTSAANQLPYFTGAGTAALTTLSSFIRTLLDDADAATARNTLGLVIGTDVQAYDAELAALAGLTSAANTMPYFTGSGTAALTNISTFMRTLLGYPDAASALAALGFKLNNAATVDPAVTDDGTGGYSVGSLWVNTRTRITWMCADTTTGAAYWIPLAQAAGKKRHCYTIGSGFNVGHSTTQVGTWSTPNQTSTNLFTSALRAKALSAASAGSSAEWYVTGGNNVWRGNAAGLGGFRVVIRWGLETNVATQRAFAGLLSSFSATGNADPSSLTVAVGMGCDSGDTTFSIMYNDNAGVCTKTSLGANFPANTSGVDMYELTLACPPNGSVINYEVKRLNTGHVASGQISTNMPATTDFLTPHVWANNNSTASATAIALFEAMVETDY